jgi:hypothetical protein
MPRDSAGNYSLPAGNPVQSGEVIASSWANSTLDDVANSLTNSLDRNGRGGMLAPFQFSDGTNLSPGATWVNEPTTGFYRFDSGDLRVAVLTNDIMRWQTSGADVFVNAEWKPVVYEGGPGSVPDADTDNWRLAWDETTTQSWIVVPPPAGGDVPIGTQGQILYWDTDAWLATSGLTIDGSENVVIGNIALIPNGSAGVPTLAFSASPTTGIFSTAPNTLSIGTAGVERVFVNELGVMQVSELAGVGDRNIGVDVDGNLIELAAAAGFWDANGDDITPNNVGVVKGVFSDAGVKNINSQMQVLTQAAYDALTPDANTLYFTTA